MSLGAQVDQAANDQAVVEHAHELEQRVIAQVGLIRASWTDLAGVLYAFQLELAA